MTDTLTIPAWFNGPPTSGNGGYTCGRVAQLVDAEVVEVSLRSPPPLDTPLAVERDGGRVTRQGRRHARGRGEAGGPAAGRAGRRSGRRGRGRAGGRARALVRRTPVPHVPGLRAGARGRARDLPGEAAGPRRAVRRGLDTRRVARRRGRSRAARARLGGARLSHERRGGQLERRAGHRAGEPHRPPRLSRAGGRAAHDPVLEARPGGAQALGRRRAVRLEPASSRAPRARSGSS